MYCGENYWHTLLISHSVNKTSEYEFAYNCYGTACTEVEVDVLTGQMEVLRVDILYDCGDRYVCTSLIYTHIGSAPQIIVLL